MKKIPARRPGSSTMFLVSGGQAWCSGLGVPTTPVRSGEIGEL
jgi:hypothetical protein